jgi:uncharacterized pyridoxal phosphate-containing UPF0001 family protein
MIFLLKFAVLLGKYDYIEQNLLKLKGKIKKVCDSSGRDPKEIYIIAVSKTFPSDAVASALDFNQLDFGENKVQELVQNSRKSRQNYSLAPDWTPANNKVKYVVLSFLIHSVDSFKLAENKHRGCKNK